MNSIMMEEERNVKMSRSALVGGFAGLSLVGSVAMAPQALADSSRTVRVNVSSTGAQASYPFSESWYVSTPAVSDGGRFTVFAARADNLVSEDTNRRGDVFVHDATSGVTSRVSVSSGAEQGNGESSMSSISADGRYVAFESNAANLVAGDTNGRADVFVHDRVRATTTLVSVSSGGKQGNGGSGTPSISSDGRYVTFWSGASELVDGDTNGVDDVFVRDVVQGTTSRVSVSSAGRQSNYESVHHASPSPVVGGRYVAFTSSARTLVDGDTNDADDVFVRDLVAGVTTRVSVSHSGRQADRGAGFGVSLSTNGRHVAFTSASGNLVAGDTNNKADVFVRDLAMGTTTLVSVSGRGIQGDGDSSRASISADGQRVAFVTEASNLVDGDTGRYNVDDVVVRDLGRQTTSLVSVSTAGKPGSHASGFPAISRDGQYVVFVSEAEDLVDNDTNYPRDDVFLRPVTG